MTPHKMLVSGELRASIARTEHAATETTTTTTKRHRPPKTRTSTSVEEAAVRPPPHLEQRLEVPLAYAHGVLEEAAELLEHLTARLVPRRQGLQDRPQLSHHHGDGVLLPHLRSAGRQRESMQGATVARQPRGFSNSSSSSSKRNARSRKTEPTKKKKCHLHGWVGVAHDDRQPVLL